MHATAATLTEGFSSPLSANTAYEAPALAEEMDSAYESTGRDGNFVKGFIVALGMEAGTTLLFFAMWQAWRFIR